MGNKVPRYNKPLGVNSECPICGMTFYKGLTHGYVRSNYKIIPQIYAYLELNIIHFYVKVEFLIFSLGKWTY